MTEPLVLRFSPPTTPLSINRGNALHWAARRRLTDPWRDLAIVLVRDAIHRHRLPDPQWKDAEPVTIQLDLPFRDRRRRDPHNYVGTVVKAAVDGLVTGGLIPDDTPEWATILEPTISHQPDKSKPLVATITITPRSPRHG